MQVESRYTHALRQTLILWASLLILGGLAFLLLRLPATRAWLWQETGEEEFFAQVKGLSDLLSAQMRPPLDLQADATIDYVNVNPFGVNTFLEQEVDPDKRAKLMQMAHDAGFHWLRQEFPWQDIEIHAKGDFEDRRAGYIVAGRRCSRPTERARGLLRAAPSA